jgi:hypothetical protein
VPAALVAVKVQLSVQPWARSPDRRCIPRR